MSPMTVTAEEHKKFNDAVAATAKECQERNQQGASTAQWKLRHAGR